MKKEINYEYLKPSDERETVFNEQKEKEEK